MGIKHLYQLIEEHTPEAVKKGEIKNQFGRKVAIDAYAHVLPAVVP
ncbi:Flap endonuclease [Pyrenophora tritici-repentis]|uniref:Flap endonuclease n=1 Tax=Pyrenophora tritici-repentis TaxID=45151 RepID=A0A922T1T2_9PLEO|nr:Flap endonuclease [Pyrenophora tritici-repentis]KAI1673763.1 Flap endonuclease [Pyrenophora tritici-repentis]KAI1689156.1 Flap endonuclease [Pyrenophora tritici-repentis]